jgi:hypothetical protein
VLAGPRDADLVRGVRELDLLHASLVDRRELLRGAFFRGRPVMALPGRVVVDEPGEDAENDDEPEHHIDFVHE